MRTGVAAATNASVVPHVQYGIDPRGWGMFAALAAAQWRGVQAGGRVVGPNSDTPETAFYGYARSPQPMATGVAPLGVSRQVVDRKAELSDAKPGSAFDDAALRIFANRLERRR